MIIPTLAAAALAAAAAFFIGRLLGQRQAATGARRTIDALQADLAAARQESAVMQARYEAECRHSSQALAQQAEALRREFRQIAGETLSSQSEGLRHAHLNSLESLLTPLGRDIAAFREQFVRGQADIGRHIRDLMEQTAAVGREADQLANALRGNSKMQGNWGEMVLDNLLQASGLEPGRDYTVQARTTDAEGRDLIPDVVVHLPGEREVVIDAKVSLTAFTAYAATDDAAEQQRLLREHVVSVRKHIRELSAKNYDRIVPHHIGYVLMFIPGEPAYVAAVMADPTLTTEAYARRVILINPTNLLMALQLAYNLWQSELQSRSVSEIYQSAERLYKKFSLFAKNFVKVGTTIRQLSATYDDAEKQLSEGRGNIIAQLEGWKKKGLNPTADIPAALKKDYAED